MGSCCRNLVIMSHGQLIRNVLIQGNVIPHIFWGDADYSGLRLCVHDGQRLRSMGLMSQCQWICLS